MVASWIIAFAVVVILMDDRLPQSTRRQRILAGVLLGALCALGYFIKLFLVPVFVVALAAWWLLRRIRARRDDVDPRDRAVVPAWSVTLGVAALALVVIAAPWVGTISAKYGTFTVGSSFAVNLESKFEPGTADAGNGPVVVNYDIDVPPNHRAISFGEDRTAQVGSTATPGDRESFAKRLSYYVGQRLDAFPAYINKIGTIAPFAVPVMCAVAIGFIGGFLTFRRHKDVLALSVVWGVYFLGYAAITSLASGGGNGRYYWPMLALGTMAAALLLPWLWERVRTAGWWRRALVVVIAIALPFSAIWGHGVGRAGPFTQGPPPSGYLALLQNAGPSLEQKLVDEHLVHDIPPDSRIMGSNYRRALKFAFFLTRVQIYGRAEQGYQITDPKFQQALRDYDIDFYLQFTPTTITPPDPSGVGSIVDAFEYFGACADDATAIDEQCLVQVIKVDR
jgi:hypothetical protein